MAGHIVVGTKECSVRDVVKKLRDSQSFHLLIEKWQGIACDLDLPEYQIKVWELKLRLEPHSFYFLMNEILNFWVARKGSEATLTELFDALESNGVRSLAETLQIQWPNQPDTNQGQDEKRSSAILPNPVVAKPETINKIISSQSGDIVHVGSTGNYHEGKFIVAEAKIDNRPETSQQEENSALTILPVAAIPGSSSTNPSDEIIPVGNKISYFPDKSLGGGFMGSEVYEGLYEGNIPVAVKQLKKRFQDYVKKEVQLLCQADKHENVVRYYCSEVEGVYRYIALELCQATLKDWVEKTDKGMEVQNITDLKILEQCVDGLMFIHEKNVVHRDLRPSNILLLKQSKDKIVVKISDFGFAKGIKDTHQSYSHSGSSGSLGWMAPEVTSTKIGDKIKAATVDIFSLGCIFYNVITRGGHPFGDKDDGMTRQFNIKIGQFTVSSNISYNSRGMNNLIKLMIDPSPNKRPPLLIVKSHPLFWNAKKVMQFSHEVKVLETNIDAFVRRAFKELELLGKDSELVFKKDKKWTETVFEKLGIDFKSNLYSLQNTVSDLNRAFQKAFELRKEGNAPDIIKNSSEEEYVNIWLEMFPQLLTCIWIVFKKLYDHGKHDFAEFYKDTKNPFWSTTERFKLIYNDLEVTETSTSLSVSFGANNSTTIPDSAVAIPESTRRNRSSQSTDITHVGTKISYFSDKIFGMGSYGSKIFKGKLEGRNVAVKRIAENHYGFSDEVKLLSIIDENQNVIKYYCNEVKDGFRYIALELCNATLKDWVEKTESGMQVQEITDLEIFTQCVSGLMFIHQKKVVHCDINPSNILLLKLITGIVIVKISDFGLAKLIKGSYMSFTTSESLGSLGWITPELSTANMGDKITHYLTIDIFSLGCVFYYVLTKGHPFGDDDTPFERQINIKVGKVKISRETPYDSRGMTNLIKMMIDSSPIKRPPLSVVIGHPVFWNAQKVMRYSSEVNARRDSKNVFVLRAFKDLELLGKDNELLFKKNQKWTQKAFKEIGIDFESKPYEYTNTVTDLNRAFRNTFVHRKEGNIPDIIKNVILNEEEYANLWLEMFPQLLTCLWVVFKQLYDNGEQDFAEFYEDTTNPFWSTTERFKFINNDLEVTKTSTGLTVSFVPKASGVSTLPGPSTSSN